MSAIARLLDGLAQPGEARRDTLRRLIADVGRARITEAELQELEQLRTEVVKLRAIRDDYYTLLPQGLDDAGKAGIDRARAIYEGRLR